jgi:hypothetical protein
MSFRRIACAVGAVIALASQMVWANVDVDANPYATIVDRNPFGLKPPPPPPPPVEQTAPPAPMAKVTMTGLLSTFGEPRVLLEIIEEPGKGGGTPKRPPPMREGERLGPVEVLAIDVVKNTVRLRNSGVETNITFEVAKAGPVPGGPGVPGVPGPPPAFTPPSLGQPQPPLQGGVPGANANPNAGGGNVTLVGGGAPNNPPGVAPLGSVETGMRTIPSRPLRTEGQPLTKEQAELMQEVNRLRGQQQPDGLQNPNAFPKLPYAPRGAPPPVPGHQP